MKIVAYVALHYGKQYLAYAIRSIIDHVDELHIIYTPIGSHGHRTNVPCPETRDELYSIAQQAAGDKFRWHEGAWPHEGAQRDMIFQYAPDAEAIIALDSDEIWASEDWRGVIEGLYNERDSYGTVKNVRVPMIHYWRSFHRAILHDPAFPIRIIFPKLPNGEMTLSAMPINHLGYAQNATITRYKWLIHGHLAEYRKDCNWFVDKFLANAQSDCHPVGSEWWQPEEVNPLDYLPAWMTDHPDFAKDIIE